MCSPLYTHPMHSYTISPHAAHPEIATEPARLVAIGRSWEMALGAARSRLRFCYALGSILLAIVVVLVICSAYAYYTFRLSHRTLSPEELARARHTIAGLSLLSTGAATIFLALVGLPSAIWVRFRHERSLRVIRRAALREGRFDALRRCGGTLDHRRVQSHWETFRQRNRGFIIGYGIAALVGVALIVTGRLIC